MAPLSASIGLSADIVYVVGLAEDLYPGRVHEDALLPHRVREAAAPELASSPRSARREATAPAGRVLRRIAEGGRVVPARRPAPIEPAAADAAGCCGTLRELTGDHAAGRDGWDQAAYGDRLLTSASYAGSLTTATMPATEQEWQVRAAAAGCGWTTRCVDRARELLRGRGPATRSPASTATCPGSPGLPDYAVEDRIASPTSLESYATCPHAYFVERLLQVEPLEAPEDLLVISPMQVGNLIHDSLDAFVSPSWPVRCPAYGEPWTAEQRSPLLANRGGPGRPVRGGRADRASTAVAAGAAADPRRPDGLLTDDDRWRAEQDASVVASELRVRVRRASRRWRSRCRRGRVLLRGSADKVDLGRGRHDLRHRREDRGLLAYEAIEADPVAGGTKLQLPVYAYAARARLGDRRRRSRRRTGSSASERAADPGAADARGRGAATSRRST